jgi:CheY-like chemotaxis protein
MSRPIDILLVDDEARNFDALEAIVGSPGYRLLRAEDAERALRLLLETTSRRSSSTSGCRRLTVSSWRR